MRLSWNEIRTRAARFSDQWQAAVYEKGETQSFYNDFFEIFGVQRRTVARYEERVTKLDHRSGFIDLFWPGVLIVEQKSAGRDLAVAYEQAGEYFDSLPESDRPRYILVSDFQTFDLYDRDEREKVSFRLSELPSNVEAFSFILGVHRVFRDQDPANIRASELVGKLHDMLDESGYKGHDLERFLVRIVFCLFADDTGIFEPRDLFLNFIEERTEQDGAHLGAVLTHLFQVLDTPETERTAGLDEDLDKFPYVNGELFRGPLRIPQFNSAMREALLDACRFNWSNISPAIFGALFQSVMDPKERREIGAHYTTEKNILKVIAPLFLDDLRSEFDRLKARKDHRRKADLRKFQARLSRMKFFDPACGCGNFLIIAYRELRLLEIEILKEINPRSASGRQGEMYTTDLPLINVDQFYGIELGEFPVRIAETALWMMDHIMNNCLSMEFGETYTRIPLQASPHIVHGDALEMNWNDILPAEECSFVFGNPPFGGAKFQSKEQRAQVHRISGLAKRGSGGTLDYVTAWFFKAGEYIQSGSGRIGFVATNSITQGEQVGQFWPILFKNWDINISFAHQPFAWGSDARGKAHVHVVILGLDQKDRSPNKKRLFSYPDIRGEPLERQISTISPYLFDASDLHDPHLTVQEEHRPINGLKQIIIGSQPIDGGHYIFNEQERREFLDMEPGAEAFMRPYYAGKGFLYGKNRWILALQDVPPNVLAQLPHVRKRITEVRSYRKKSKRASTLKLARTPTLYQVNVIPEASFLVIPRVTSERREYIPIGWMEPPRIPSDALLILPDATLGDFALLTSAMHMAWTRTVTGRLESRYLYSAGVVYNTFPLPQEVIDKGETLHRLTPLAQAILDARNAHPQATLANLYDPDIMPLNLRQAHQKLDSAVDKLYHSQGFESEQERVHHLFRLYENIKAPLMDGQRRTKKHRRK